MAEIFEQRVTKRFALYHGDCVEVASGLPDNSVGYSVFSPPFCDLYVYSNNELDLGNSRTKEEFFKHYSFLTEQLYRVMMPGRSVSVHCCDLPIRKQDTGYIGMYDFPGDLIRHYESYGFIFHSRVTIWKDPLVLFMRTKAAGLAHKQIVSDSSLCKNGGADYLLTFRKKGENPKPVTHPEGLTIYHGARHIPRELDSFLGATETKSNKRSHWIWQQYASPVWMDIRQMRVLDVKHSKDVKDEKHVCPLQLDVIERCIELWSTKRDVVFTPFMGVGSEAYVAVKNGRKAVGVELKKSYYRQAVRKIDLLMRKQEAATP